jgi:hypothetical protein
MITIDTFGSRQNYHKTISMSLILFHSSQDSTANSFFNPLHDSGYTCHANGFGPSTTFPSNRINPQIGYLTNILTTITEASTSNGLITYSVGAKSNIDYTPQVLRASFASQAYSYACNRNSMHNTLSYWQCGYSTIGIPFCRGNNGQCDRKDIAYCIADSLYTHHLQIHA